MATSDAQCHLQVDSTHTKNLYKPVYWILKPVRWSFEAYWYEGSGIKEKERGIFETQEIREQEVEVNPPYTGQSVEYYCIKRDCRRKFQIAVKVSKITANTMKIIGENECLAGHRTCSNVSYSRAESTPSSRSDDRPHTVNFMKTRIVKYSSLAICTCQSTCRNRKCIGAQKYWVHISN